MLGIIIIVLLSVVSSRKKTSIQEDRPITWEPIPYKDKPLTVEPHSLTELTLNRAKERNNAYIEQIIDKQLQNAKEGKPIRYAYIVKENFQPETDGSIKARTKHFIKKDTAFAHPLIKVGLDPTETLLSHVSNTHGVKGNITYSVIEIDVECTNKAKPNAASVGVYKKGYSDEYHLTIDPQKLKSVYQSYSTDSKLDERYDATYPLGIPKQCYKASFIPSDELAKASRTKKMVESVDALLEQHQPLEVVSQPEEYQDDAVETMLKPNRPLQLRIGTPIGSTIDLHDLLAAYAQSKDDKILPAVATENSVAQQQLVSAYNRHSGLIKQLLSQEIQNGRRNNPVQTVFWVTQQLAIANFAPHGNIEAMHSKNEIINPFFEVSLDPSIALDNYIQRNGVNDKAYYVVAIRIDCTNDAQVNDYPVGVYSPRSEKSHTFQLTYDSKVLSTTMETLTADQMRLPLNIPAMCYSVIQLDGKDIALARKQSKFQNDLALYDFLLAGRQTAEVEYPKLQVEGIVRPGKNFGNTDIHKLFAAKSESFKLSPHVSSQAGDVGVVAKDKEPIGGTIERFRFEKAMDRNNPYIKGVIQKQLNSIKEGKPIRYAYWVQKDFIVPPESDGSVQAPTQKLATAKEPYTAPVMHVSLDPSQALYSFVRNTKDEKTGQYSILEIDLECTNSIGNRVSIGVYEGNTDNYYLTFDFSFLEQNYYQYASDQLDWFYSEQYPLIIPRECYTLVSIPADEILNLLGKKNVLNAFDSLLQHYKAFEVERKNNQSEEVDDTVYS